MPERPIGRIFSILALATFTGMLGMTIIIPLIPLYMERLALTPIWVGVIFAVFSGTRLLLAPIVGRLSDRYGRKYFLVIGLILSAIASLGYIWASADWHLVLVRILHGAASGMVYPIAMSYLGDITPKGREGRWMGYFNAVVFTSFGLGPLFGGLMAERFGILITFSAVSGLCLVSLLLVLVALPESLTRQSPARQGASFKGLLTSGVIRGLFTYRLALEMAWGIWVSFIAVLAHNMFGLGPSLTGILLTANVTISALLMVPFGRVADRIDKRRIIMLGGFGAAISIAITPLATGFGFLLALSILAGAVTAAEFPASSAMAVEEGRRYGMGSTMAVMNMAMSGGMVLGPLLGGAVMEAAGINTTYYVAGGVLLLGIAAFALLSSRKSRPPGDELPIPPD
jgi:DHA1 family multidrug resistance protein-like MFS transporter